MTQGEQNDSGRIRFHEPFPFVNLVFFGAGDGKWEGFLGCCCAVFALVVDGDVCHLVGSGAGHDTAWPTLSGELVPPLKPPPRF